MHVYKCYFRFIALIFVIKKLNDLARKLQEKLIRRRKVLLEKFNALPPLYTNQ